MLQAILFMVYVFLFYRTLRDTFLLSCAEQEKKLDVLSYYYLIYRRRFVFICAVLVSIFMGTTLRIICLLMYLAASICCFINFDKIKYDRNGTKISLSLFLKTYRFLRYNIGCDGISYKGENIYFNSVSFVFLCFIWNLNLRATEKKYRNEKEIKFYKLIVEDLQKEKAKLRMAELENKTKSLTGLISK